MNVRYILYIFFIPNNVDFWLPNEYYENEFDMWEQDSGAVTFVIGKLGQLQT